ncbi:MAG: ABC transporter permease [Desulfurococcales archaeon]|nr:ABC transporter permease [Desulfurococcales archaeon]
MRWVVVKLVNLFIVLLVVSFVVAALASSKMAEIEINMKKEELNQQARSWLQQQVHTPQYEQCIQNKTAQGMSSAEATKSCNSEFKRWFIDTNLKEYIQTKGLDKPWYIISWHYTIQLLSFQDLRSSQLTTRIWDQGSHSVLKIIGERIPFTIILFTTSSILTLLFAMPLALYAARKPGSLVDNTIMGWSVFSVSMPWWWLGMVFIYVFSVKTHLLAGPDYTADWTNPRDVLYRMALPVITVTLLSIGDTAFRLRNILLDTFNEDFVTVARAKGVPERDVLRKHVLRAAAPPIVTIVLFAIVLSIVAGAIITELIFNWFGLGRLYWDAITGNDIPVLVELTYITTLLYLVVRFVLDILYTYLDPRIRRA